MHNNDDTEEYEMSINAWKCSSIKLIRRQRDHVCVNSARLQLSITHAMKIKKLEIGKLQKRARNCNSTFYHITLMFLLHNFHVVDVVNEINIFIYLCWQSLSL